MAPRRIVVTGLGCVSPYGLGVDTLWKGLEQGRAALRDIVLFDTSRHRTSVGGEVPAEELARAASSHLRRTARTDRLALEAAREAVESAGIELPESCGVFFGTSTGGMLEGESEYLAIRAKGSGRMSRLAAQPIGSAGQTVARLHGLRGPVESVDSACAASTMAFEAALMSMRAGETDVALAGGADALCQLTYGGFNSLRAVDARPARPFRPDREGLSMGEGAGVLVLETEEHANRRGATILAELAGAGSSCDAHHMTAPEPGGAGAARAMSAAIRDAGIAPEDVDFVNAHGTGTPHNDVAEWHALGTVFGTRRKDLPVTSTKGAVGHLLGGCGAVEAVAVVRCLLAGAVHPTPGSGPVDPECPVDLVLGEPRRLSRCDHAVSVNLAFGGANAAIVLRSSKA